ncbi:Aste57867_24 [Aphanomyces stellatus]|uniref:Aste57867_24 protein n=1 Tax=Aphanomyces stellatus TaxID=120398 RepID=A0A485K466_9STRA|nr:hypothetical protein As57867_000024 [Aphanomyces stellatus]VFT77250.1 Aste57867_24 [Aphanomyces stellatus]
MAPAAAAVCHSPPLFLAICAFQSGRYEAIQILLDCSTIEGIHGRVVVLDDVFVHAPSHNGHTGVHIHMDALPALMDVRRCAMAAILDNPRATADLHTMLPTFPHFREVVAEYAAFYGDVTLMEMICKHAKTWQPWVTLEMGPCTKSTRNPVRVCASHLYHLAAFNGHLPIVTILASLDQNDLRCGALTMYSDLEVAAERGHLTYAEQAIDFWVAMDDGRGAYWGLCNRVSKGIIQIPPRYFQHLNLLDIVAGNGRLDIARVLFQRRAPYSDAAIDHATTGGHLAMARYFHEMPESKCTTQAMDGAAANGHLKVVQFLHEYRQEGCTTDAMDVAARNGHDDVVRFLQSHREEGGTRKTLSAYITRGDLAMVKLTSGDKISSGSVNLAAALGHLAIAKHLVGDKQTTFAAPAIEAAVKHGHVAVVEYLHGQRPEMCVAKYMQVAYAANQVAIVEYFDSRRCQCCRYASRDDLLEPKPTKKRRRKH